MDVMFDAFVASAAPEGRLGREEVIARMRRERREAMSILGNWIRRASEFQRHGVSLWRVCDAYADLGGREAVPLLADRMSLEWRAPLHALARIDDPFAAEAIRHFAELQPENISPHNFTPALAAGSEAARAVVRHWAFGPPSRFTVSARTELFLRGTEKDRDRVWRSTRSEERIRLSVSDDWPAPWLVRRIEAIRTALAACDPRIRMLGCWSASRMANDLPTELVKRALAIVEDTIAPEDAVQDEIWIMARQSADSLRASMRVRGKDAEIREQILR